MPTKILLIDNYDSFTFNLVHYLEGFYSVEVNVVRNDNLNEIVITEADAIVISPGPGLPKDANFLLKYMELICSKKVLGVCLGMQALIEYFGGGLTNLDQPVHGQNSLCFHNSEGLFNNTTSPFKVGRYHSWVVNENIPNCFTKTGWLEDKTIMGIRHKTKPIVGVQFHPESVLTENGFKILENWLNIY